MTFLASVLPPQTERRFMAQVVAYAEMMGWKVYHPFDSRRSAAGFPDLVAVRRPRVVWAELKSDRGRVTAAQHAWLHLLSECGQEVYLWHPRDWPVVERVLA